MKFTIVQSNPSNEGKTFVTKLQHSITVDLGILGTKSKSLTYYISTNKQAPIDAEYDVNLDMFNIVERPYTTPDGEEIQLKWLHLK